MHLSSTNLTPKRTTMSKNLTLVLLAVIAIGSLFAADGPDAPASGSSQRALDSKRPIQFDIWLDKMEVPAEQKATFYTSDRVVPKFKLLGGWLENGRVSAAYAPSIAHMYPLGHSEDIDWDLCLYGGRASLNGNVNLQSRFTAAELKMTADAVTGNFAVQFFDGRTPEKALSPPCQVQVEGKRTKDGWLGRYTGRYGDFAISGPCMVIARQVPAGLHDPQNGLYQIQAPDQPIVFLEVRGGKVVRSAAFSPASADILSVAVESFSVATQDFGLNGRGAALGGRVTVNGVSGKPAVIALDGLVLSRAGRLGGAGYQMIPASPIKVRLDSLDDPQVAPWRENLNQIKRGMLSVASEVAAQALQEANEIESMPVAGPLTRYLHRLTAPYHGCYNRYIYAPWFDFQAVEGAVRYRYEVKPEHGGGTPVTFQSDTPQASLAPVWNQVAPGIDMSVRLIGLDAGGKELGKPQELVFRRRPPLATLPRPVDPEAALALALRQPHFLTDRLFAHLYITQAVQNAGLTPYTYPMQHWRFTPQLVADAASDPVLRDEYQGLADSLATRRLADDESLFFKTPFNYGIFTCGMVDHSGRNLLNLIGDRPNSAVVDRLGTWVRFFARLQQPSGSWTFSFKGRLSCFANIGLGGVHYPDQNSASWLPFLARYRRVESDLAQRALARAMEDKAQAWVRHNSLRTGYWENIWQNSPGNHWNSMTMALEYLLYDPFHAPAANRDPMMQADLLRWQEDHRVHWNSLTPTAGSDGSFGGCIDAVLALSYVELYAQTGDPLALARSEALAGRYLANQDLIRGSTLIFFLGQGSHEGNDSDYIVRWARRYRQMKEQPPTAIPERHLSLTLDRVIDGSDRVVLDLAIRDGRIVRALARTPTWDGPGENSFQPGRLHWRAGKALFHRVDIAGLKLDKQGLTGQVRLWLKEPQAETVREVQADVQINRRWTRGWQGRWTAGKESGRISGLTVEDAAITGPVQLAVRIPDALGGGEGWQNWVSVMVDPASNRGQVLNPNAGWTAETKIGEVKLGEAGVDLNLEATIAWHGVAEIEFGKGYGRACGIYKTKPEDRTACLSGWAMDAETKKLEVSDFYNPGIKTDRPGDMNAAAGYEYKCAHRPVTAGAYRFQLKGEWLGDIIFGTAQVTGPDGKARTCQFLGDREAGPMQKTARQTTKVEAK